MSTASPRYYPISDPATAIMYIVGLLNDGRCPFCTQPILPIQWISKNAFVLSCSACTFSFKSPAGRCDERHDGASCVRQEDLLALAVLRGLNSSETGLRRTILELVESGATVEPGNLDVEIRETQGTVITQVLVSEVLGQRALELLKSAAEAKPIKMVYLRRPDSA